MAGRISGLSVAVTAAGGVLVWSGWQNTSLTDTFRSLLNGKLPAPGTGGVTSPSSAGSSPAAKAGDTGAATKTAAENQQTAKNIIAANPRYAGWDQGQEWADLVSLWNQESGWNNTAENPTSGAYGIAQALGHGPTNQYPAGPANPPTSDPAAQIEWGLSYIAQTYGNPQMAWGHEVANGWY